MFLYAFEESVDCHLLSSFCDYSNLHISLFKYVLSVMGVSKESISKFLIGNWFRVKLRILSPYSNRIYLSPYSPQSLFNWDLSPHSNRSPLSPAFAKILALVLQRKSSPAYWARKAIIRVFRALDWLSSISGSKVMPQKPRSGQNLCPYKRKPGLNNTQFGYGHNSPPE